MKNLRILLAIISFIVGIIMIFTASGYRAVYLGGLCMVICIAFLYYAKKGDVKQEKQEQPEQPEQPEQ